MCFCFDSELAFECGGDACGEINLRTEQMGRIRRFEDDDVYLIGHSPVIANDPTFCHYSVRFGKPSTQNICPVFFTLVASRTWIFEDPTLDSIVFVSQRYIESAQEFTKFVSSHFFMLNFVIRMVSGDRVSWRVEETSAYRKLRLLTG